MAHRNLAALLLAFGYTGDHWERRNLIEPRLGHSGFLAHNGLDSKLSWGGVASDKWLSSRLWPHRNLIGVGLAASGVLLSIGPTPKPLGVLDAFGYLAIPGTPKSEQ